MQQRLVNRVVLLLLLVGITLLFLALMRPFLQPIFVAGLFAALFKPLDRKIQAQVGGRRVLSASLTLITITIFIMVPLVLVLGTVAGQAVTLSETALPWARQQLETPGLITKTLEGLPFYSMIEPFREMLMSRLGDFMGLLSGWIVEGLQAATKGTVHALINIIIVLYTLFFFLIDGDRLLFYIMYYLPLNDRDESRLLHRFTSVTRATLKGTAVIGFIQGALAGFALYLAGIPSSLFWAVSMMMLSIVPGVGTALIWVPAAIYLAVGGDYVSALAVALFCGAVVGTIDNVLRPKLVGNDTQLHELMIFFSTLGGLIMFGFMGFVIGPIIAALFVTLWELYGDEFKQWLPATAFKPEGKPIVLPHERRAAEEREMRGEIIDKESSATLPDGDDTQCTNPGGKSAGTTTEDE